MDHNTYKDILAGAIEREVEAYNFYYQVSQTVQDVYLKDMFRTFAAEELMHRDILIGFTHKADAGIQFARVPDFHVSETVSAPVAALSLTMKPVDAIALAMKKEEASMRLYTQMAEVCSDPDQAKVFLELAVMEQGHKAKLESAFVDIGYPEVW
ncbi:MAG: rubrerythrin [Desulfobacteraceae bacterium]|nr:MAG: rubrerythrin [Desulfobacteraceae bacterium]